MGAEAVGIRVLGIEPLLEFAEARSAVVIRYGPLGRVLGELMIGRRLGNRLRNVGQGTTYKAIQVEDLVTVIGDDLLLVASKPEHEVTDQGDNRTEIETQEEKKVDNVESHEHVPEPIRRDRCSGLIDRHRVREKERL